MASIRREVRISASADVVWDALRDVGAIHRRLAPGFVVDVKLDDGGRVVTFGNGMVVRERIVDVDDTARRLVWSAAGVEGLTHYNASAQVFPEGDRECRFVWIADLLPNELAPRVQSMIEAGIATIKRTLDGHDHPVERPEITREKTLGGPPSSS
jgi:carbon monoxide dehydrogenase subunit G